MKKKIITLLIIVLPVVLSLSLVSCKKAFDIQPKSVIPANQMYRNVFDADGAVVGIYGKFLGVMDRYVILNELRSDLADITPNSDQYLKQLSTHTVTADNPYADPRPFYEVIQNCNDALANFKVMLANHTLTVDQFNQRYSDIGALRSWLYLQLGIQYGTIPYVTEPIKNINDLNDQTKYPRLNLTQLVNTLVSFMETLPYMMPYPSGSTLLTTVDTYSTAKMFIDKNCLLGDLYLWQGNWVKAATAYMQVVSIGGIPYNTNPASEQTYEYYKLGYTGNINGGSWANIFGQPYGERYSNYEIMWDLPYDKNFSPKNPFIDLFSTSGSYLIRPSDLVMKNWNTQFRNDNAPQEGTGTPTDIRGLGRSYTMVGNQPQINKYFLYTYNPSAPFETAGKVILYRGATLFLRYAEAATHTGRDRLAMAFVNNGVSATFNPQGLDGGKVDVTNVEQSVDPVTGALEVAPFYFDARMGSAPYYRSLWYRNVGVRARVGDRPVVIDSTRSFDLSVTPRVVVNRANLINDVEDLIIAESGLETAFEGNRWGDLLRIALRRQATDPNYLANKIGAKFDAAHSPDAGNVKARLADPSNWFLPFKLK
ncbi:MAG: RagB/SusD family protein [Bacteroidota bacterium]|nr:RagB/SusD family protein [Bacteroidota bacterium]